MGQQNWDEHIKNTLEKRAITPSKASWDVLADRLETAEKHKKNIWFWRLGVAASIVGILFTTLLIFTDGSSVNQKAVIVNAHEQIDKQLILEKKVEQQEALAATEERVEIIEENETKTELLKTQKSLASSTQRKLSVAKNDINKAIKPLSVISQKETLEDQKVTEIVAQIQDFKNKGQTVTDADIDVLLHKAQRALAHQTIMKESIKTVDANALLQDVETDLQHSFRNKIFEALKNSYETVITAVAERNN